MSLTRFFYFTFIFPDSRFSTCIARSRPNYKVMDFWKNLNAIGLLPV